MHWFGGLFIMILTYGNCQRLDDIMSAPEFKGIVWDNHNMQIIASIVFGIVVMNHSMVVSLFVTEDNELDWNSQVNDRVRIA